jgi:hypothetical protein
MVCINKNMYKIYLNKYYYRYSKETINECIAKILLNMKKIYNIDIYSVFNIKCYINDNYGIILEIEREYDPFYLYTKKTDLKVCINTNSNFLYEVDDYFISDKLDSYKIYIYNNKYYIELLEDDYMKIIEHTNDIICGNDVKVIVNNND